MKHPLCALLLFSVTVSFSQPSKIKPNKYPSLLWEIRGKGLAKPSYLFGTMHVSSKMVFNLSDSFYIGIRNAQVVALETNPGTWQEDFSRYDMDGESQRTLRPSASGIDGYAAPHDYLTLNTLKLTAYEKLMEAALYSNPSIINNFLYRSRSGLAADFEEDTYLDLHIFQAGKKLGKKLCGVEDFDGSMELVKEAYADAAREKNKKEKGSDYDEEFSYRNMEVAYRSGNLDLLDTINKVNSQSAAFDEKFLYRRNEIQAHSIDSILKKGLALFAGVGAAHLPGNRGVIELLCRAGYTLRPIKMQQRDGRHKDAIERLRVPVQFAKQTSADGFFSVNTPGKFYRFGPSYAGVDMQQYADMTNGSYYMVTRVFTNAAILGQSEEQVQRKIDSVLYENIPGKILSKKPVVKNGYRGFDLSNRTRHGDYQRYNIFITPFEIIIFKMSGTGDYVKLGTEADQFFSSIQLKETGTTAWKKFKPAYGGFEVELPHDPLVFKNDGDWQFAALDAASKTAFEIIRTDVHNHSFVGEDSFDLDLMEESFGSSEFIQRQLSRRISTVSGYPALDLKYKFKDSSVALVRFLLNGPRYYTLIAKAYTDNRLMQQFIQSFSIKPFVYGEAKTESDTALFFRVKTPVLLEKKKKLSMYPDEGLYGGYDAPDDDDSLVDRGKYTSKIIENDSTGEKIYVSFYKPSAYFYDALPDKKDSMDLDEKWVVRRKKVDTLSDKAIVTTIELGGRASSRMLEMKAIEKDGVGYELQTETDTLATPSAFVQSFFESFTPIDKWKDMDTKKKKTPLFFSQFFSKDTLQHRTALKNIASVKMDSTDFINLKKCLESLSWKEKNYLDTKKAFIGKFSSMPTKEASDYLRTLYPSAGDTLELQYAILETLLQQSTAYSYKTFASLLENDPPVLNATSSFAKDYSHRRIFLPLLPDENSDYNDGSFINNLNDSLQLTAGIYKNLLPLINLDDYKEPVMSLTAMLLDSSLIGANDYEAYLPKFLIEAKQLLKKQIIGEKSRAIEKAREMESEKNLYNRYGTSSNDGNARLSLYASLLIPFWDKNEQVPQILLRMLGSNDRRLKYNTAITLLHNKRPLPDTLLNYFAASDEYRYELYNDLRKLKKLSLYPAAYNSQEAIARSQLLFEQSYNKPDTVAFLTKIPLAYKDRSGYVYVFKYKETKADNNWKLATVGLLPKNETGYWFEEKDSTTERDYDFTTLSSTKLAAETPEKEQIQKLVKRLLYSKRKSAAQFYSDEGGYGEGNYSRIIRD